MGLVVIATIILAYGVSNAIYLIKTEVAQSKEGAAYNIVALNIGGVLAGLFLLYDTITPVVFFTITGFMALCCLPLSWKINIDNASTNRKLYEANAQRDGSVIKKLPWIISSIVFGIKIFAVLSILPQAILDQSQYLPSWYGLMLILNCLIVAFFQMPILKTIEKTGKMKIWVIIGIITLGFGIIALTNIFHIYTLLGATIWLTLFSMTECALKLPRLFRSTS